MTTKAEATKEQEAHNLQRAQDHINSLRRRARDIEEAVKFYEAGIGTIEEIRKAISNSYRE